MTPAAGLTEAVLYDTLVNYLISMARVVESAMNRALDAIIAFDNQRTSGLPGPALLLDLFAQTTHVIERARPGGDLHP